MNTTVRSLVAKVCLVFLSGLYYLSSFASENSQIENLSFAEVLEQGLLDESSSRMHDIKLLQEIKTYIINGNVERAKVALMKLNPESEQIRLLKYRYQALTYFIEGKHGKALHVLNHKELKHKAQRRHICGLKIVLMIFEGSTKNLGDELNYCSQINQKYSLNDEAWLNFLVQLKKADRYYLDGKDLLNMDRYMASEEMVRIWLKMGLYLNMEDIILSRLRYLPYWAYRSPKIRELLGLIHYRKGMEDEALKFIEDLDSPNASNILGNLSLKKNQYELAFGHFQLALKKKQNSANAIERSITLAWILGNFEEGLRLAEKVRTHSGNIHKKRALKAAFLTRLGHHLEAFKELEPTLKSYTGNQPLEINQLAAYNALLLSENDKAKKYADLACRKKDGIYCHMLFGLGIWEDLGNTIRRDDSVLQDKEINLNNLKSPPTLDPLEEETLVDQRDIEELDDLLSEEELKKLPKEAAALSR